MLNDDRDTEPSHTVVLMPTGELKELENIRARKVDNEIYEILEHPFVYLVPGDQVKVDAFGVAIEVHKFQPIWMVEVMYEFGQEDLMHDEAAQWVANPDVEVSIQSSISCLVSTHDDAAMADVTAACSATSVRIIRRPDRKPAVDIWRQQVED